jgi:hypothetical protein
MNVRERFRAPKNVKLLDEDAGLTPLREKNGEKNGRRMAVPSNASGHLLPT